MQRKALACFAPLQLCALALGFVFSELTGGVMNVLFIQCGGPTPVLNASLVAAIAAWQNDAGQHKFWGSRLGLQGLVDGDWVDLTDLSLATLDQLRCQPGAALGSSRHFLAAAELPCVLTRLQNRAITCVLVNGGNGAMAAAQKLAQSANAAGYQIHGEALRVIGIPKTVDNDLVATDTAPGYGSAACFVAQTTRDIGLDLYAMRRFDDVAVLETMGRHAGWLTGAAALARQNPDDAPELILLPEITFDEAAWLEKVQAVHQDKGICLVVASEGIRDARGQFLAEKLGQADTDARGQKTLGLAAGVAPYLAHLVRQRLGLRCRQIRPDTIQRSSSALTSATDRHLAEMVGTQAIYAAQQSASEVMIGLTRMADGWQTFHVPLATVIGQERKLPPEFIDRAGWGVTPAFVEYVQPLVGQVANGAIRF